MSLSYPGNQPVPALLPWFYRNLNFHGIIEAGMGDGYEFGVDVFGKKTALIIHTQGSKS